MIITCLQYDVTECRLFRRSKHVACQCRNINVVKKVVLMTIYMLLGGQTFILLIMQYLSNQSHFNLIPLQKFAFYRSIKGNHHLTPLGPSRGFTDCRFRSGVCTGVSASMKRSEATQQPDKKTSVRVSDQVNPLVI